MGYYRSFFDWKVQETKSKLLLALILKKMSTQPNEDKEIIEKVLGEVKTNLQGAYEKVMYLPKDRVSKLEYETIKQGKLLLELQKWSNH